MRIILIRHAESEEDINPNMHNVDDSQIGITERGKIQAKNLASNLKESFESFDSVKIFHSPPRRVRDTAHLVLSHLPKKVIDMEEVECIRNLNWGDTTSENVKDVSKQRYDKGVLYFQFPNGDKTPDFVKNIKNFVRKKVLSLENRTDCVIIFTHGFALRVIAKHILNISDEKFRFLANPKNCFYLNIDLIDGNAKAGTPLPTIIL